MATKKKLAAGKSQPPKGKAPDSTVEESSPVVPHSRSIDLEDWLEEIRTEAAAASSQGALKGACLVPNPRTGGNDCLRTDQASCAKFHGTWIGGPCGPS
jgi:hypothetical protein